MDIVQVLLLRQNADVIACLPFFSSCVAGHTLLGRAKRAVSMLDVTAALTEKLPDKPVARLTDDVTGMCRHMQ